MKCLKNQAELKAMKLISCHSAINLARKSTLVGRGGRCDAVRRRAALKETFRACLCRADLFIARCITELKSSYNLQWKKKSFRKADSDCSNAQLPTLKTKLKNIMRPKRDGVINDFLIEAPINYGEKLRQFDAREEEQIKLLSMKIIFQAASIVWRKGEGRS